MRSSVIHYLAGAAAAAGLAGAVQGDIIIDNFVLTGGQEVPPNGSDAVGAARFIYDTDTNLFDIDITVFGISLADLSPTGPNGSPVHIHAQPPGTDPGTANGPIVVDLGFHGSFVDDGLGITLQLRDILLGGVQGGITSDPDENELALFQQRLYVNVHTLAFPGGEIRGQIIPTQGTAVLVGMAALVGARRYRRRPALA